ncbi:MAG: phytanoyl-CoA dioxygenase family protein [Pseudomonadota bacterium]
MVPEQVFANTPTVLRPDQRAHFYDEGYLAIPALLDKKTVGELRAIMQRSIESSADPKGPDNQFDFEAGHSPESPKLRRVAYVDDLDSECWRFCADSIIADIAADLLGPNLRFREVFINFKWAGGGAEVKWHQDIVFYPHTNTRTCQFLIALEDISLEQGPLQVIPGSHKGPIFEHYDEQGNWTGAMRDSDMITAGAENAIALTGPAGSMTVHHSCMIHGSDQNLSDKGRPVFVITYTAADAIPYTAVPYPSSHYGTLVRGVEPGYAQHEAMCVPMPPDWSGGYTSIFAHQEERE